MTGWSELIRSVRAQEHLSREKLAHLSGVSVASITAYERGARHPSRTALVAILDTLGVDAFVRAEVLESAGFAADGKSPATNLTNKWFTLAETASELAAMPHPACVTNELFEVLAANATIQRVWEVDLHRELSEPFERGFLSMLSRPRFADRLLNWDEALSVAVAAVKGHYGDENAFDPGRNPYLSAAVEHLLTGHPAYVQRFLRLWGTLQPRMYKVRLSYPVVWNHSEAGPLKFLAVTSPANARPSLWFNDWIPQDGRTVEAVEKLGAAVDERRAFFDVRWTVPSE